MKLTVKDETGIIAEKYLKSQSTIIGRSKNCDLAVPDESLSRQHARVEYLDSEFYITDLDSANGVYIDGDRIKPNRRTIFKPFHQVTLGKLELTVADVDITNSNFNRVQPVRIIAAGTPVGKLGIEQPPPRKVDLIPPRKTFKRKSIDNDITIRANLLVSVFVFLIIVGYLITKMNPRVGKAGLISTVVPDTSKENRLAMVTTPESLLDESTYDALREESICSESPFRCTDLRLRPQQGEALAEKDRALFVFFKSSAHLDDHELGPVLQRPDGDILVGLYLFFRSSIISQYHAKAIDAVHLVFLTDNLKIQKAYLVHQKSFSTDVLGIGRLLDLSQIALKVQNPQDLWTHTQGPPPMREFIASRPIVMSEDSVPNSDAVTTSGITGLTWGKVNDGQGFPELSHVSCFGYPLPSGRDSCNPTKGDTDCATKLPVLCLKKNAALTKPELLPTDPQNAWSSSEVRLTPAIEGTSFANRFAPDEYCRLNFGNDWRMATFQDGGGGGFWAKGKLHTSTRFWVAIDDQNGNCWNKL